MTSIEKMIQIIENLISLNNKRIDVYKSAVEKVGEVYIKIFLTDCIAYSERNIADLKRVAEHFSGESEPDDGNESATSLFEWLKNFEFSFYKQDTKSILNHCEKIETSCLKSYNETLEENGFEKFNNLSAVLTEQKQSFMETQKILKNFILNAS